MVSISRNYYHIGREIWNWCTEQFGEHGYPREQKVVMGEWSRSEMFGRFVYRFKEEENELLFILRWGEFLD